VSTTSEIVSCRACGLRGPAAGTLVLHESMFGTLEPFAYARCGACGSLSIVEVPDDLGAHYPDGYYAHATTGAAGCGRPSGGPCSPRDSVGCPSCRPRGS
jgi:hypothetical protein